MSRELAIEWTADPTPTTLQHGRRDHRRGDIFVSQEFLDGADIRAQDDCTRAGRALAQYCHAIDSRTEIPPHIAMVPAWTPWLGASAATPPHMQKEQGQPAHFVLSSWAARGSS